MISGALYHLVATYSVMNPVAEFSTGSAVATERARPKSQTLRSQLALRRRLEGLRSRWITSAEWRALRARRVLVKGEKQGRKESVLQETVAADEGRPVLVDKVLDAVWGKRGRQRGVSERGGRE
jgi:hypothetical protein